MHLTKKSKTVKMQFRYSYADHLARHPTLNICCQHLSPTIVRYVHSQVTLQDPIIGRDNDDVTAPCY